MTSAEAAPKKAGRLAGIFVILLVVGVPAMIYFGLTMGGDTIATLDVQDTPSTASFRLTGKKELSLWTDLEIRSSGFGHRMPNDELPHVLDYVVTISRGGERLSELHCNPFDSNIARTSGTTDEGRSYDGFLNGCELEAPPGDYQLEARREWLGRDGRITFVKTHLIVRAK